MRNKQWKSLFRLYPDLCERWVLPEDVAPKESPLRKQLGRWFYATLMMSLLWMGAEYLWGIPRWVSALGLLATMAVGARYWYLTWRAAKILL